jgi:hypothetical protein
MPKCRYPTCQCVEKSLAKDTIVLDASDIRPAVVQLARAGNNLNQIAHWLNWHDYADDGLRRQTLDALAEIREAARALTAMAGGKLPKRRR